MKSRDLEFYRRDYPDIREDYVIPQGPYTAEMHETWKVLYARQCERIKGLACTAFVDGLGALDLPADRIPDFDALSARLSRQSGWSVVPVPALIPDAAFYLHLANRQFPAGNFIRARDSLDYIEEPDVFHDVFGHLPLLTDRRFGDLMQRFGETGLEIATSPDPKRRRLLVHVARLYWYTVEFGLIEEDGLRIFGAGILSSYRESPYALHDRRPNRIAFDAARVMRTDYCISKPQRTYFVLPSLSALSAAVEGTLRELTTGFDTGIKYARTAVLPNERRFAAVEDHAGVMRRAA
jgi:phenylalanine-4-hydroxylase